MFCSNWQMRQVFKTAVGEGHISFGMVPFFFPLTKISVHKVDLKNNPDYLDQI
jgi:hypothetical protein